ncbi:MAG: serine/threonine-protein phosphatase [Phycisphaeraceae bacterium]|nr:serine/threonine-protein phosphatase [Phycisphaeraceae bacterium]
MGGRTLTVVTIENGSWPGEDDPALALLGPVLAAWPRPEALPRLDRTTFHRLLDAAERLPGLVLALCPPAASEDQVRSLMHALKQKRASGVLLVHDNLGVLRAHEDGGLVIESVHTSAPALARTLFGLLRRQDELDEVEHELRHQRISSGGLVGQMTQWHQEMHLAATVQRELLPHELPQVEGLDCGVFFRPAGYVSGDIYDISRMPDGRIAFFVADAVGHGVPAALLTMVIGQSLARTHQTNGRTIVTDPGEALARVNAALCSRQFHSPRFATGVYGLIDPATGQVWLAGAGHPPPLRLGPDGVERIELDGPLMGVFPDAEFATITFTLQPGESLVLYSDGFETVFPPPGAADGETFKPNREFVRHFADLLTPSESGPGMEAAIARLAGLLDAQRGSLHQADDLTALVICRVPVTASVSVTLAQAA